MHFASAVALLAGSILFFWNNLETIAIWFFVVGPVLFGVKPTIWFLREMKLAAMGDEGYLGKRE